MGYQTDFVGHLVVHPPLSEFEVEVVNRISGSIFLGSRPRGPRPVDEVELVLDGVRRLAPLGWSNWRATPDGCVLAYDGGDKANHMIPWLKFLLDVVLTQAAADGPAAGRLSRDHVVDGIVVGSRRDNGELYAIVVRDNRVEVELMWPGEPDASHYPKLGYQVQIDRFRAWVVEHHGSTP